MPTDCLLAIDIGGSKLLAGLATKAGQWVGKRRVEYEGAVHSGQLLDDIVQCARSLMGEWPDHRPNAVGVSVPGLADVQHGIWVYSPFSGTRDVPISSWLREQLDLPVYIQNDVNACALAEKAFGACRGVEDYIWVTVSNGIGGALVLGGRLYEGSGGNAGEIGHVLVQPGGARCGCGKSGCLEAQAAGPAISRMYLERTGRRLSAKQIARAAHAGDADAAAVFDISGYYIGRALACAANLLNPKRIVLGGGVAMGFSLLEDGIRKALNEGLFDEANQALCVAQTGLGYDAGLLGAAVVAMEGS